MLHPACSRSPSSPKLRAATIKLAIFGLIANALFQVVPHYYTNWQFHDALKELAAYPGRREPLPRVLDKAERIAKSFDLDLTRADFDIKLASAGGAKLTTIDVPQTGNAPTGP